MKIIKTNHGPTVFSLACSLASIVAGYTGRVARMTVYLMAVLALAGCATLSNANDSTPAISKAHMVLYYQTYNSENPDKLRDFYHDDVEFISSQGVTHGPDAIIATYRFMIANFRDQMTPQTISIEGDTAVVRILDEFIAKQDVDNFMGSAIRQGDAFSLNLRGSYQMRDGKFRKITIELLE